jgi:site-specific recombinase XerC
LRKIPLSSGLSDTQPDSIPTKPLKQKRRNPLATELLNTDADLCTIQDLLGHSNVKMTQRYCRVSNLKVQREYFNAMQVITKQRTACPDST